MGSMIGLLVILGGGSAWAQDAPAAEVCYYELEWQHHEGSDSRYEKIGVAKGQTLTQDGVWAVFVAGAGREFPPEAHAVAVTGPICVPVGSEPAPSIVAPPPTPPPPNPCALLQGWNPLTNPPTTPTRGGGENIGDWFGAPGEVVDAVRRACAPPAGQQQGGQRRPAERDGLVRIQLPDGRATYTRVSQLRAAPRPNVAFVVDPADGPPSVFVPGTGATCEAGGGGAAELQPPRTAGAFTVVTALPNVDRLDSIRVTRADGSVVQFGPRTQAVRRLQR